MELAWDGVSRKHEGGGAEHYDGEPWAKQTAEVLWEPFRNKKSEAKLSGDEQQCKCSTFVRKVGIENLQLRHQVQALQSELQEMRHEKKSIAKSHRTELEWREKKEIGIAIFVGLFAFLYVVSALVIRGFV